MAPGNKANSEYRKFDTLLEVYEYTIILPSIIITLSTDIIYTF